jgi:small conductance mechanosensitive channel
LPHRGPGIAIAVASEALDEALRHCARQINLMEQLGLDAGDARTDAVEQLNDRAKSLAVRIQVTRDELRKIGEVLAANADDTNSVQRKLILEERLNSCVASLRTAIDQLELLGQETTDYRKLLVTTTGDVGAIGFDSAVLTSLVAEWAKQLNEWFSADGARLLAKFLVVAAILLATWLLAGAHCRPRRSTCRSCSKRCPCAWSAR